MRVYAANSVSERRILWNDLTILKHEFEVPMFVVGNFNETLNTCESRGFLNLASTTDFKSFTNT